MRTHASRRLAENLRPHELYMKLTSLEIERARRITERDATLGRLSIINDRIEDLERQKEDVLEKIDAINSSEVIAAAPSVKSARRNHLSY
ncbi:MAG TPA: hypothetical protein DDZ51_13310 [Planctomycetaceae bacterium]|nr:hypothetical protein [Planctomycetaceae bacterium]